MQQVHVVLGKTMQEWEWASNALISGLDRGHWVVLEHCDCGGPWMPHLGALLENVTADRAHPGFRLFLTASRAGDIPHKVLSRCIKFSCAPRVQDFRRPLMDIMNRCVTWTVHYSTLQALARRS